MLAGMMDRDTTDKMVNNWAGLILSAIFPGVGQIYRREYDKGLTLIICVWISVYLMSCPAAAAFILGGAFLVTLWVWGLVDAGTSRNHTQSESLGGLVLLVGAFWTTAFVGLVVTMTTGQQRADQSPALVSLQHEEMKSSMVSSTEPSPVAVATSSAPPPEMSQVARAEPEREKHVAVVAAAREAGPVTKTARPEAVGHDKTTTDQSPRVAASIQDRYKSFPYMVSAGAFSNDGNAERLQLRLSQGHYQADVIPVTSSDQRKLHLVIVSGFTSFQAADAAAKTIRQKIDACPDAYVSTPDKPTIPVSPSRH